MLDAMIAYLWPEGHDAIHSRGRGVDSRRSQRSPDLVFKTSDGYITCGTISDSEWQGFCRATGDRLWPQMHALQTPSARSGQRNGAHQQDAGIFGQHTTAEWLERLDAADVPCAPILRRGDIIHNEQVVARGLITELDSRRSAGCGSPMPPRASRSTRPRLAVRHHVLASIRGQVLRELGYDEPAIEKMVSDKASGSQFRIVQPVELKFSLRRLWE
jgi:crotonobetainyl-CoA:carnitine CoA-transferase CaiB-like acyl-CoA transferase